MPEVEGNENLEAIAGDADLDETTDWEAADLDQYPGMDVENSVKVEFFDLEESVEKVELVDQFENLQTGSVDAEYSSVDEPEAEIAEPSDEELDH